jgi:hypothetical protein
LNIIYVDDFHEGVESDAKLFRGPLTRHSLESISNILRACLESSRFGCEPSGHQLDHGDSDPRFGRFG